MMNKRTKENLGFLLLGGALSFLFCELTMLKQNTQVNEQAEIIDAYDQYWHVTQDNLKLEDWVTDGWDLDDPAVQNYDKVRENLVKITNYYESNPNHIHQ